MIILFIPLSYIGLQLHYSENTVPMLTYVELVDPSLGYDFISGLYLYVLTHWCVSKKFKALLTLSDFRYHSRCFLTIFVSCIMLLFTHKHNEAITASISN